MTDRYVSSAGNDSFDGSLGSPWKTVQKAMDAAQPGDTVNVRAGTYTERLACHVSGATGNIITFQPYGYGSAGEETVTFDYTSLGTVSDGVPYLTFEGINYVTVQGFTFQNHHVTGTGQRGLHCWNSSYITINDCLFSGNKDMSGGASNSYAHHRIWNGSRNVTISSCEYSTINTSGSENLAFDSSAHDCVVRDCYIHDLDNVAICVTGAAYGVVIRHNHVEFVGKKRDGSGWYSVTHNAIWVNGGHDSVVERNWVNDCHYGIVCYSKPGQNATFNINIRNNILVSNNPSGLMLGNWDSTDGSSVRDCSINNNTIDTCVSGIYLRPTGGGGSFVTAVPQYQAAPRSYSIQQVTEDGRACWRFELRDGDVNDFDQGNIGPGGRPNERAEMGYCPPASVNKINSPYNVTPNMGNYQYKYSIKFAPGFPTNQLWATYLQFHPEDSVGTWAFSGIAGHQNRIDIARPFTDTNVLSNSIYNVNPIQTGVWYDLVLDINWSTSSNGWIKVYRDGALVGSYNGATQASGSGGRFYYLIQGYYRDGGISATGIVYETQLQIRKVAGSSLVFKNNIISNCPTAGITLDAVASPPGTWDSNTFYANGSGPTPGSNVLTSDPRYTARPTNFALQQGSPAIDSGVSGSSTSDVGDVDYAGAVRINNSRVDRGAIEYGSTVVPVDPGGQGGNQGTQYVFDPNTVGAKETGTYYAIAAIEILAGDPIYPQITSAAFNLAKAGYAPSINTIQWVFSTANGPRYCTGARISGNDFAIGCSLFFAGPPPSVQIGTAYTANSGRYISTDAIPFFSFVLGDSDYPYAVRIQNPDGSFVEWTGHPLVLTGSLSTVGNFVDSAQITGRNFADGVTAFAAAPSDPSTLLPITVVSNSGTVVTVAAIPYQQLGLLQGQNPIIRIVNPDGAWTDTTGAGSVHQNPPPPPPDNDTTVLVTNTSSVITGSPVERIHPKVLARLHDPESETVNRVQDRIIQAVNPTMRQLAEMPAARSGIFKREGWSDASLLNGWKNVTGSLNAGFVRDAGGTVHLRGEVLSDIKNVGLPVMVLPESYRPVSNVFAACYVAGTSAVGMVQVGTEGAVRVLHVGGSDGSPVSVSIGGISFPSE